MSQDFFHPTAPSTKISYFVMQYFDGSWFFLNAALCAPEVGGLFFSAAVFLLSSMCVDVFCLLLTLQRRTQQQEQLSIRYKEMVKCQTLPIGGEQVPLAS